MKAELHTEQQTTLESPRLKAGLLARLLFVSMDIVYGRKATLSKFRVLEVIARVPYMAWEHVGYVAITHAHRRVGVARRIHDEVASVRAQQDNEFFHLLILEEMINRRGVKVGFIRHRVLPQIIAWAYYQLSCLLYVVHPRWSYALNAQFEDHAEHEYMQFVADHPELDDEPWESAFAEDYGDLDTVGDVLRQIGLDERHHKEDSLEQIPAPRFGLELPAKFF